MQDKIRSKYTDWDLLDCSGINQVFKCFELIGAYETYNENNISKQNTITFNQYYTHCIYNQTYYFRNVGIHIVYKLLQKEYIGFIGMYHISKRSMRHYGITYRDSPVVVYESSYIILGIMLRDIINHNDDLKEVYYRQIHRDDIYDFLTFQSELLDSFIGNGRTIRQRYYSNIVRQPIRDLLLELRRTD